MSHMYEFLSSCKICCTFPPFAYLHVLIFIQATAIELRGQITTLQAALERARQENATRKVHEAKLTSQLQVCLCCKQVMSPLNLQTKLVSMLS